MHMYSSYIWVKVGGRSSLNKKTLQMMESTTRMEQTLLICVHCLLATVYWPENNSSRCGFSVSTKMCPAYSFILLDLFTSEA